MKSKALNRVLFLCLFLCHIRKLIRLNLEKEGEVKMMKINKKCEVLNIALEVFEKELRVEPLSAERVHALVEVIMALNNSSSPLQC
jgi:hypothetical protein